MTFAEPRCTVVLFHLPNGQGSDTPRRPAVTTGTLLQVDAMDVVAKAKPTKTVPRGGIEPPTRGFSVPCSTN